MAGRRATRREAGRAGPPGSARRGARAPSGPGSPARAAGDWPSWESQSGGDSAWPCSPSSWHGPWRIVTSPPTQINGSEPVANPDPVMVAYGMPSAPLTEILTPTTPTLGDQKAPVLIVEFSDFTCGYCGRFYRETLPALKAEYLNAGKVRFAYRDYPRDEKGWGLVAAHAARCAGALTIPGAVPYAAFQKEIDQLLKKR